MSLMRLLTSGKTLVGLQGAPLRYRMTDPRAMPSFNEGQDFYSRMQKGEVGRGQQEEVAAGVTVGRVEVVQMELTGKAEEAPSSRHQPPETLQASNINSQDGCEHFRPAVKVEEVPAYDIQIASADNQAPSSKIQAPEKPQSSIVRLQAVDTIEASITESLQARKIEGERTDIKAQSAKSRSQSGERKAQSFERTDEASGGAGESPRPGPARAARGLLFSQWAERLGAWLPLRARPVRAAQRTAQPQQAELALSLDKVKVVRNDLSDCDVEIIAAQDGRKKSEVRDQKAEVGGQRAEGRDQRAKESAGEGLMDAQILGGGTGGDVGMWGRATKQWFGNPFAKVAAQQAEVLPSAGTD
jgi:hypothetical protein